MEAKPRPVAYRRIHGRECVKTLVRQPRQGVDALGAERLERVGENDEVEVGAVVLVEVLK